MSSQPFYLLRCCWGMGWSLLIAGRLIRTNRDIKGSRNSRKSKQNLKGLLAVKLVGYLVEEVYFRYVAIGSGLMLSREGPSIQLGRWVERSGPSFEGSAQLRSGLPGCKWAALVLPLPLCTYSRALFCGWRGLPSFSVSLVSTLAASLTANFISLNLWWSNTSASYALNIPPLPSVSVLYLFSWSLFRGSELCLRNSGSQYRPTLSSAREDFPHVPSHYSSLFAFILILPIGYFFLKFLVVGTRWSLDLGSSTVSSADHPSLFYDPFHLGMLELW